MVTEAVGARASRVNHEVRTCNRCHQKNNSLAEKRLWLLGQEDRWLRHSRSLQYGIVDGGAEIPEWPLSVRSGHVCRDLNGRWRKSSRTSRAIRSRTVILSASRIDSDSTSRLVHQKTMVLGALKGLPAEYGLSHYRHLTIEEQLLDRQLQSALVAVLFHLFPANQG